MLLITTNRFGGRCSIIYSPLPSRYDFIGNHQREIIS